MSVDMMNEKVKELWELRCMADGLTDETESIRDKIKRRMTAQKQTNTI